VAAPFFHPGVEKCLSTTSQILKFSQSAIRGRQAMTHPHFIPTVFTRHNRFLHAIMQANQAWFCVQDLGRLMGRPLDQRLTLKLDPDQRQYVWLLKNGKTVESLMVSESGMYALLVHHSSRKIETCVNG